MKRYLVLRIHIPVTGTDNQTIVVWCIKCGWQELPVSYPYPFSPSVVTESWLVAGNIVTMIKIISPRRRYQRVVPGSASGQLWCKWKCRVGHVRRLLSRRATFGTLAPTDVCDVDQKAASPTAISDHAVTLKMKIMQWGCWSRKRRADDSMELLCQPQTVYLHVFSLMNE